VRRVVYGTSENEQGTYHAVFSLCDREVKLEVVCDPDEGVRGSDFGVVALKGIFDEKMGNVIESDHDCIGYEFTGQRSARIGTTRIRMRVYAPSFGRTTMALPRRTTIPTANTVA
jgi:hypothetical protein